MCSAHYPDAPQNERERLLEAFKPECLSCFISSCIIPPPRPWSRPPTSKDDELLPSDILTLSRCRLTPQGVKSVTHHLTSHPLFADAPQAQLSAMTIAFLAHGGVRDDRCILPCALYPIHISTGHSTWRLSMRHGYMQLVMDMVRVHSTHLQVFDHLYPL